MQHHDENRRSQLGLLTQTAPDSLMGKLLRTFWHPIALSSTLEHGKARELRILSEDLTLYRGESGTPYLVGGRCAHRCTVLHTGWVQGEQIRCMYHGWRYDGNGICTEQPAETRAHPEQVRIAGYPLQEYKGLIFAYMGEGPAPAFDLPMKDAFEDPACDLSTHEDVWDCNWVQHIENSLDGSHLAYVHQWPEPSRLGAAVGSTIPELAYEETSAGIRQTATRPGGFVRISNWTFPNNNFILSAPPRPGDPWVSASGWMVPIDDENTLRISILAYPGGEVGAEMRRNGAILIDRLPQYADIIFKEHRLPEIGAADQIMAQDYAAIRGQGRIHDRTKERLGASDAGIALLRRIMFRELELINSGKPTKHWTREAQVNMPLPAHVS
jgi:5,5'-dehydrodivanillate O-demethylase